MDKIHDRCIDYHCFIFIFVESDGLMYYDVLIDVIWLKQILIALDLIKIIKAQIV